MTDTLLLVLSGDQYKGNPIAQVQVDGNTVATLTVSAAKSSNQTQPFLVQGTWGGASVPHTVSVSFTNSLYEGSPTQDRNLYVESMSLNGVYLPMAPVLLTTTGEVFSNTFSATGTTPVPSPDKTIITDNTGSIVNATGFIFTLVPSLTKGLQVAINNKVVAVSSTIVKLGIFAGNVYYLNMHGTVYLQPASGATGTVVTSADVLTWIGATVAPPVPATSPPNTQVNGTTGSINDGSHIYTISSTGQIVITTAGVANVVASSANVVALFWTGVVPVLQLNSAGDWWTQPANGSAGSFVPTAPSGYVAPGGGPPPPPPPPGPPNTKMQYDLTQFALVQDYRFGNARSDATVKNKSDLDLIASPRYIYGGYNTTLNAVGNGCDGLYGNYWARHVDTPEGATAFQTNYGPCPSVHVFTAKSLILKALNNPTSPNGIVAGRDGGGILSGMLRLWANIVPNKSFIRVRCKLPSGKWGWPALWLNPGHEDYAPLNGPRGNVLQPTGWPPEIDLHDGFGYDNTVPGTLLRPGEPTNGNDAGWNRGLIWDNPAWANNPGYDYQKPGTQPGWLTTDFHEIALDWTDGILTYYCDGIAYTQRTLTWDNAPASACAHLLFSNQVVAEFNPNPYPAGVPDQGGHGPGGWDYEISDIQVYQRVAGSAPNPGNLSPAPSNRSNKTWAALPNLPSPLPPSIKSFGFSPPTGAPTGPVNPSTYP